MVKNPPAKQETWVWSPAQEDPLEKSWPPISVLLPIEFHGQRSLSMAGYSPWGRTELAQTNTFTFRLFKLRKIVCSFALSYQYRSSLMYGYLILLRTYSLKEENYDYTWIRVLCYPCSEGWVAFTSCFWPLENQAKEEIHTFTLHKCVKNDRINNSRLRVERKKKTNKKTHRRCSTSEIKISRVVLF